MPSVIIEPKKFARKYFHSTDEGLKFIKAVGFFIEAEAYIRAGTDPGYNIFRAQKDLSKLGLPEEEAKRAITTAQHVYEEYLATAGESMESLSSIMESYNIREAHKAIEQKKRPYQEKFRDLMGHSDIELRIYNSSQRVDLNDFDEYIHSGFDARKKFRQRTLSQMEYSSIERRLAGTDPDILEISVQDAGNGLMSHAFYALSRDFPTQRQIKNWEGFQGYVVNLLSGKTLSKAAIEADGFDPNLVKRKARNILFRYLCDGYDMRTQVRRDIRRLI